MGRFLTPSKIALLVLAQIYTKGSIPVSGSVNVLQFLISRVLFDSTDQDAVLYQESGENILDFEKVLDKQPSNVPGRSIWDLLLKDLWSIDCADALDWAIMEMPRLLGKTREELLKDRDEGIAPESAGTIVRTSPLGVFIRRCSIEWQRLRFSDSQALYVDFIAYRMSTKTTFTRKNPHSFRNAFDANFDDFRIGIDHPLAAIMFRPLVDAVTEQKNGNLYSTYDLEKLMEFQVSEMQSYGGRLPNVMISKLKQLAVTGNIAPRLAHYLKFLDTWRAGDFTSAFDNLHRYFDYTMQSRDRTFYQYALLNLAILHADFGCHDEAIPAMQEAIATARENRDTICLNYCMSWLYHFGRAYPAQMQAVRDMGILGNEIEGLNFLKSRAKEAEMWTLLSTSLLSEAKLALQHGDSLASCFENITKAAYINIVKAVPNSTGPSLLMKGTVFARIGQTHMSRSCGDRFLLCHQKEAPLEDILKCTVRQANTLAATGRYAEAQTMLANIPVEILKVLKYKIHYTTACLILRAQHLLHRGHLDSASAIISQLVQQQPHPELDTSTQVSLLEIDLLTRQKRFQSAVLKLEHMANSLPYQSTNDVQLKTRLQILKAGLLAKSNHALGGFSLAMRALDTAYRARAMPALWEAVLALAVVLIAAYESEAVRDLVTAILPGVLETQDCDLSGRTYTVLADAYVGMAGKAGIEADNETRGESTAETGPATKGKETHPKRTNTRISGSFGGKVESAKARQKRFMAHAMTMLEKAGEQFRFIEEVSGQLDVLAKMARICTWRGDTEVATEMADRYMEIKRANAEEEDV